MTEPLPLPSGALLSLEQRVAMLPPEQQEEILAGLDVAALAWSWRWSARPEQYLDPADESWSITLALAGRGAGKQLSLDTLIPTPSGWKRNGDLVVGDEVFDEHGNVCRVTAIFDGHSDQPYRLKFSDGTEIVACSDHQWVTWTHAERKQLLRTKKATRFPDVWAARPSRTTQELVDTLTHGKRGDRNHCIPLAGPLTLPEKELPIEPWVLGLWLGDGNAADGGVTIGAQDKGETLARVAEKGYRIGANHERREGRAFRATVHGILPHLRALGVQRNKHVPAEYLRASEAQRLELLRGLMDADGTVDRRKSVVEFCATNRYLAEGVLELARSLGERPTLREGRATLNGKDAGAKFRVLWRPRLHNPFTLTRKAEKIHAPGKQALRLHHRMLVAAEPAEAQPMRCITVDSPNSMYLAGEGMVPTHNTKMSTEWIKELDQKWEHLPERHGVTGDGTLRIALLSRTAADVRDVLITGPSGLMNIYPPSLADKVEWISSQRKLVLPGGAVCTTFSAEEPDQLRGPEFHIGLADELAAHRGKPGADGLVAWDNLRIACRMGRTPQIMGATTPKRTPLMRKILKEATDPSKRIQVRRMKTTDNPYLSDAYLAVMDAIYGGTQLGKQELDGEMLDDVTGALVKMAMIDKTRLTRVPEGFYSDNWLRVVGVDPSVSDDPTDECGIIVAGAPNIREVHKRHAYVVEDASMVGTPAQWARRVVELAHRHNAVVVVESNQGGAMAELVIKQTAKEMGMGVPKVRQAWASTSKMARAEPIGTAYERGRIHHINVFPELESVLTEWVSKKESGYSPDRLDANVWALTPLLFPQSMKNGLPGTTKFTSVNRVRAGLGVKSYG